MNPAGVAAEDVAHLQYFNYHPLLAEFTLYSNGILARLVASSEHELLAVDVPNPSASYVSHKQ